MLRLNFGFNVEVESIVIVGPQNFPPAIFFLQKLFFNANNFSQFFFSIFFSFKGDTLADPCLGGSTWGELLLGVRLNRSWTFLHQGGGVLLRPLTQAPRSGDPLEFSPLSTKLSQDPCQPFWSIVVREACANLISHFSPCLSASDL